MRVHLRDRLLVGAVIAFAAWLPGCSGDDTSGGGPADASHTADATQDVAASDDSAQEDVATQDTSVDDSGGGGDATAGDGGDAGTGEDASDGACPPGWLVAPGVDPSIAVPDGGGGVLLHASATGSQDYTCEQAADGGYGWVFVGPEAELHDCHAAVIGHHFASDAGASAPEWQTLDGTYVVGHKVAAFTPDAGPPSVPWLLLQGVAHGGSGSLAQVAYVQRLDTDGGVAPGLTCDPSSVSTTQKVPYAADYYFFGP